jgi:hypothetical protein
MRHQRKLAQRLGLIVGARCALLFTTVLGHASNGGDQTEEFHQTYLLAADGRISVENINGPVHITAWDRNEVKLDAVKRAWRKERLDEAKIQVRADASHISISTQYPEHDHNFWNDHYHDNPASVEYTLMVPRGARLDEIELVNGSLDVEGVAGEVRASCVNGRLIAHGLQGRAELSTVNSRVEAEFNQLSGASVSLESVNGSVRLTLPSDASAEISASSVSGRISDDFGIGTVNHRWVGHDLRGQLGDGRTRIRLENVNGEIEIHRAGDNRPLSTVKSLNRSDRDDDDDDDDDSEI